MGKWSERFKDLKKNLKASFGGNQPAQSFLPAKNNLLIESSDYIGEQLTQQIDAAIARMKEGIHQHTAWQGRIKNAEDALSNRETLDIKKELRGIYWDAYSEADMLLTRYPNATRQSLDGLQNSPLIPEEHAADTFLANIRPDLERQGIYSKELAQAMVMEQQIDYASHGIAREIIKNRILGHNEADPATELGARALIGTAFFGDNRDLANARITEFLDTVKAIPDAELEKHKNAFFDDKAQEWIETHQTQINQLKTKYHYDDNNPERLKEIVKGALEFDPYVTVSRQHGNETQNLPHKEIPFLIAVQELVANELGKRASRSR